MLHQDNASSHTERFTAEFLEKKKLIDPFPQILLYVTFGYFFYLSIYIYIKENGHYIYPKDDIDETAKEYFSPIPRNEWFQAFTL